MRKHSFLRYIQILTALLLFSTFTITQVYAHHATDCPTGPSNCGTGTDNGSRVIGQSCSLRGGCGTFAGEPVSLRTGNMTVSHTDFVIQTGGMPIYLTRTYNSHTPSFSDFWALPQNELGVGWHHNQQSATGIKFLYNNNGAIQPTYGCVNCGGGGSSGGSSGVLLPSPWYYSGSPLSSYPELVILYHGTMPYYFHQKSSGTSNYDPMKGLGGYKLEYSSKTVTTPKGTKILFSENHVERRTGPSGAYLLYNYANKNLGHSISSSSDRLSMIHAYLADGTLLRRGMIFNYKKENFESPLESQNHDGLISAGIVDTKTLPTCTTDSQCYTKGYPYAKCIITPGKSSGYCSTCYKTYASGTVWDESQLIQTRGCSAGDTCMYPTSDIAPLVKYSWETSPISGNEWGIFGFCAKKVVEYEYDKHTVRYKRMSDKERSDTLFSQNLIKTKRKQCILHALITYNGPSFKPFFQNAGNVGAPDFTPTEESSTVSFTYSALALLGECFPKTFLLGKRFTTISENEETTDYLNAYAMLPEQGFAV